MPPVLVRDFCQGNDGEIKRIANALLVSMANTPGLAPGERTGPGAKNSPPGGGDRPDQLRRLVDDLRIRTLAPLPLRRCSARQRVGGCCQKTRVGRHWAWQVPDDSETTQAYSTQSVLVFARKGEAVFKVRVRVIDVLGDTEKYPCHFNYKVGDEIVWTGAELKGRICPSSLQLLAPKINDLYKAGPRWVDSAYYLPFWYAPPSARDSSRKKYDGLGFRNVSETIPHLPYGMSLLLDPKAFTRPPCSTREVAKDVVVRCPDTRTSVVFKLEAFDLADDGLSVTFFRRMMVILSKVLKRPEIPVEKIIDEFSEEERDEIYPALSPILVECLLEELSLIGFLEVKSGRATTVTSAGEKKLEDFIEGLGADEREALRL